MSTNYWNCWCLLSRNSGLHDVLIPYLRRPRHISEKDTHTKF